MNNNNLDQLLIDFNDRGGYRASLSSGAIMLLKRAIRPDRPLRLLLEAEEAIDWRILRQQPSSEED